MKVSGHWVRVVAVGTLIGCSAAAPGFAQTSPDGGPAPPGAVGYSGSAGSSATSDRVVAEVGGQQIRQSELADEIKSLPGGTGEAAYAQLYDVALKLLVERAALVVQGRAVGLTDDPDVARHMQEAADQVLEDAYLQRATANRVTEAMLLARYAAEIAGKPGPIEVHGRAILVPTEAEAAEIIAKLQDGADFAALARQFSKDASASKGGDMGFVSRDSLNPAVGAVLFTLRPGTVTAYPVKTVVGWFVLRVDARRTTPTPTFAQARAGLLAECQRDAIDAVVQAALRGADSGSYDSPMTAGANNNGGISSGASGASR